MNFNGPNNFNKLFVICRTHSLARRIYTTMSTDQPSAIMNDTVSNDYSTWPREKLIDRIKQLEEKSTKIADNTIYTQRNRSKKKKEMDFSKYTTRKIAIRFAYLGWNYQGLAVQQQQGVETVESQILKALSKTKLIPSMEVSECEFSRCGRTDKGVSAFRQVISLRVRSKLTAEEQADPSKDCQELDYLRIINNSIPNDIVLYEICLRPPPAFDARFSCQYRHYHYYFRGSDLDITAMRDGAARFMGENDFRNFCKIDASKQITNFKRTILISDIVQHSQVENLYYFSLRGTAFLWHQVRSMIAVLLLVGQKLEAPSIISDLLDITKYPCRPVYDMAADYPLVLHDCGFPEMEWSSFKNSHDRLQNVQHHTFNLWHDYWIKQAIVDGFAHNATTVTDMDNLTERIYVNTGGGYGRGQSRYEKLNTRTRLDPPDVINARYSSMNRQRKKIIN